MAHTIVVGAGLVGSLLAAKLADLGHEVDLFDRHPDPRQRPVTSGRSINLTICERGFTALDGIGAGDRVRALSVPCRGRVIHAVDGGVELQPYGNRGEAIHSVSRNDLNRALLDAASARPGVRVHFEQRCAEVDLERPEVAFRDGRAGEVVRHRAERLFGADGAYSAVRLQMQRSMRFNYAQEYLDQGYKELRVPPAADGGWALEKNAIHIWPRGHYMLIGFPNLDASFTLSLHMPFVGEPSFASILTPDDLLRLFRTSFPDALSLVPDLVEDFFGRPETAMVTVRCFPWTCGDRVALVGDAAHAIVPSYGQGANAGFEDCAVLADCLAAAGDDWRSAFVEYERLRKPNADAIADLALEHFVELRDLVGDPGFLLRKEVERWVSDLYPDRYAPLYALISFTNVPYVEARRRDREQRSLVDRLLALPRVREQLGGEEARSIVDQYMTRMIRRDEALRCGSGEIDREPLPADAALDGHGERQLVPGLDGDGARE